VMSGAPAVVHGLFLRAVSHAFSLDIRGCALDEGRVKPSPDPNRYEVPSSVSMRSWMPGTVLSPARHLLHGHEGRSVTHACD
jgi:hypothetical protein